MANLQDLGDEEFMAAWDEASEQAQAAADTAHAFGAEHQRRLVLAEEKRLADKSAAIEAGEYDPSLDQTVGAVQD